MNEIVKQLRIAAQGASRATKLIAASKTERNRAAGDALAVYAGCEPYQTLEWLAASEIEKLQAEVERVRQELDRMSTHHNAHCKCGEIF